LYATIPLFHYMKQQKTVKIDSNLHRDLKIEAAKRNEQLRVLIDRILREWLKREAERGWRKQ